MLWTLNSPKEKLKSIKKFLTHGEVMDLMEIL